MNYFCTCACVCACSHALLCVCACGGQGTAWNVVLKYRPLIIWDRDYHWPGLAKEAKMAEQQTSSDLFISCLCFPSGDTKIISTEHHDHAAFKKKNRKEERKKKLWKLKPRNLCMHFISYYPSLKNKNKQKTLCQLGAFRKYFLSLLSSSLEDRSVLLWRVVWCHCVREDRAQKAVFILPNTFLRDADLHSIKNGRVWVATVESWKRVEAEVGRTPPV